MKYFSRDRTGVLLEAANKKYKPVRPKESLVIGGVVKSVIRKYR
jgi:SOS-response transcriptional repressor LexA